VRGAGPSGSSPPNPSVFHPSNPMAGNNGCAIHKGKVVHSLTDIFGWILPIYLLFALLMPAVN